MANTLFSFVSIRGTLAPKLTIQDLSTDYKESISATNNFKPIAEFTEAEKKQLLNAPLAWMTTEKIQALQERIGENFLNLKFQDTDRDAANALLVDIDEYKVALRDYELMLYKIKLDPDHQKFEESLINTFSFFLLVNAYKHKKEVRSKIPGTEKVADTRVYLPVSVIISRKHPVTTKEQKNISDIDRSEIYKNDQQLLKKIIATSDPSYNASALGEILTRDTETLNQVSDKLAARINEENNKKALERNVELMKINQPVVSGKPGVVKKIATFFMGTKRPPIKEPPAIVETPVKMDASAITEEETNLLKVLGAQKEAYSTQDLLTLDSHAKKMGDAMNMLSAKNYLTYTGPVKYINPPGALGNGGNPPPPPPPQSRPEIRNVGIGDLYRVEEKTIAYKPSEISYIENIMTGETRLRVHSKMNEIETTRETETIEESETERDLTTTSRFNLKSETEKSLKEDFSVKGGVNTSGQYGPVKVDTTTQLSYDRSSEQSRKEAVETANEVVSKAVERTKTNVRELKKVVERQKIKDRNEHSFKNDAPNPHINGIFQFVDKIKEVSLLHYGKRLMLEFYIPEPAMSLLEKVTVPSNPDYPDPGPFTLQPAFIQPYNYLSVAAQFGIGDLDSPPPLYLTSGFSWKSAVDEDVDEYGQETAEGKITIPKGYLSDRLYYSFSSFRNDNDGHALSHISISVGGISVVDRIDKHISSFEATKFKDLQSDEGLAVSIRATSHFDQTATVNLGLKCKRSEELLNTWRLDIFKRCKQKHEELKAIYLKKKEETSFFGNTDQLGVSDLENQGIIKRELKKWCIKAMRGESFEFNDTVLYNSFLESDPYSALKTQPYIWFHENSFEWENMVYLFYPYFWGNRNTWRDKMKIKESDNLFQEFLQAGYAKVIVPVNPDAQEYVLQYLADPQSDETTIYEASLTSAADHFGDLWMELLADKVNGLSRGSGTLNVSNANMVVAINADSNWVLSEDDIARVLVIEGVQYTIIAIDTVQNKFTLDKAYERPSSTTAKYFVKGKLIGTPWEITVPTPLIYLTNKTIDQLP